MDLFLFAATAAAFVYQLKSTSSKGAQTATTTTSVPLSASSSPLPQQHDLSLAELTRQFPSLDLPSPTSSCPLIGLLFFANWCPDCIEAAPFLQKVAAASAASSLVRWHYVSSDTSADEMKVFLQQQPPNDDDDNKSGKKIWGVIPFDNEAERTALKRHFGTCASKETAAVGLTAQTRRHGIPTLILLETATGRVLTTTGVEDCMTKTPAEAVEGWKSLLSS